MSKVTAEKMKLEEDSNVAEIEKLMANEQLIVAYNEQMGAIISDISELGKKLSTDNSRPAISNISKRIKSTSSIIEKLERKKKDVSVENMFNYINDIAGVRIVCLFLDDVYKVRDYIRGMESVKVIKEKDFIVKPKSTGYESIHLIVRGKNQSINGYPLKVEIQIRTIAMDFWSVLEYQLQ